MGFTWSRLRRGDLVQKYHIDEMRNNVDNIDDTKCVANYATFNFYEKTFVYGNDYISDLGTAQSADCNVYNNIVNDTDNATFYSGDDGGYDGTVHGEYDVSVYGAEKASDLAMNNSIVCSADDSGDYTQVHSNENSTFYVEDYAVDKQDNSGFYSAVDGIDNSTYVGSEDVSAKFTDCSVYFSDVNTVDYGTYYNGEDVTANGTVNTTVDNADNGTYYSVVDKSDNTSDYGSDDGTFHSGYDSRVFASEDVIYNYGENNVYDNGVNASVNGLHDSDVNSGVNSQYAT